MQEKDAYIESLLTKNQCFSDKIQDFEKKFKEIGKSFDLKSKKRDDFLFERLSDLENSLLEKEKIQEKYRISFEKLVKELNFLNLSLESDLNKSQSSVLEQDLDRVFARFLENFKNWKSFYEKIVEKFEKERDELFYSKEKEVNHVKNQLEKVKNQVDSKRNREIDDLKQENEALHEKNQALLDKIQTVKNNYIQNDNYKNEILQKLREKLNVSMQKIGNFQRFFKNFIVNFKEFTKNYHYFTQGFNAKSIYKGFYSVSFESIMKFKAHFQEKLQGIHSKNEQKQQLLEENIAKIKDYFTKHTETLLKKQENSLKDEFSKEKERLQSTIAKIHSELKDFEFVKKKNESLERELSQIKDQNRNKLQDIESFEEKLQDIREEIEILQSNHKKEKEQIYEKFRDKNVISKEEAKFLKKKIFDMEKMIEKIAEMNSLDHTLSIDNKIRFLRQGLEDFEDFSNKKTIYKPNDGFSFDFSKDFLNESYKTSKNKRLSLGGGEFNKKVY